MLTPFRWAALVSLCVLPGAWIALGALGRGHPARTRLLLSVILSPAVLLVEFYALRLLSLSFDWTVAALVLVNLGAAPRVIAAVREVGRPAPATVGWWAAALVLPLAYIGVWLFDVQVRANWGHAWTHNDIVGLIAGGQLRPEEPQLAGVALAYAWTGHVVQAVWSRTLGTASSANYLWTNLVLFGFMAGAVAELVRRLGGGLRARAASVVWLAFGVNWLGAVAPRVAPAWLVEYPIWGDFRFTPWLRKVGIFEGTLLGMALFAALVLLLADRGSAERRRRDVGLVAIVLVSLAVFYPILFPAGVLAVLARLAAGWVGPRAERTGLDGAWLGLGVVLAAVGVFGIAYLDVVTVARTDAPTLGLAGPWFIKTKGVGALVVLAPLLAGAAWLLPRSRRPDPVVSTALVLAGLASALLYAVLDVYHYANEYKYMFAAALCLAPFPALATERILDRVGRHAGWALAAVAAGVLAAPALQSVWTAGADAAPGRPVVDAGAFDLVLAPSEELAAVFGAVRHETPPDAVLVTTLSTLDPVSPTGRPQYVAAESDGDVHGLGLTSTFLLLRSRAYDPTLVEERRAQVTSLFEGSPDERAVALDRMSALNRPLVVLTHGDRDALLIRWLEGGTARPIHRDAAWQAWLVDAPTSSEPRPDRTP